MSKDKLRARTRNTTGVRARLKSLRAKRRSEPNPDRPMLPDEMESQFVEIDQASAACYEKLEDLACRAADLAAELSIQDCVPAEDIEDEPSVAHRVEDLREVTAKRRADTDSEATAFPLTLGFAGGLK